MVYELKAIWVCTFRKGVYRIFALSLCLSLSQGILTIRVSSA